MVRNRKAWGVLGLLLALVVVVGYGQQPPVGQPLAPQLVAVLTVNHGCTSANIAGRKIELFTRENDVHPVRNITYQNDPASIRPNPFPRPDNPDGPNDPPDPPISPPCAGVAYFAAGGPTSSVIAYVNPGGPVGLTYTFKLCLRKSPGDAKDPVVNVVGHELQDVKITKTPQCECGLFDKRITIPATSQPVSANWDFTVSATSVEFCRVEVWK